MLFTTMGLCVQRGNEGHRWGGESGRGPRLGVRIQALGTHPQSKGGFTWVTLSLSVLGCVWEGDSEISGGTECRVEKGGQKHGRALPLTDKPPSWLVRLFLRLPHC